MLGNLEEIMCYLWGELSHLHMEYITTRFFLSEGGRVICLLFMDPFLFLDMFSFPVYTCYLLGVFECVF